jgi:hypothetical protein
MVSKGSQINVTAAETGSGRSESKPTPNAAKSLNQLKLTLVDYRPSPSTIDATLLATYRCAFDSASGLTVFGE